jgi:hypothetical protein
VPGVPSEAVAVPVGEVLVALFTVEGSCDTGTTSLDGAEDAPGPATVIAVTVKL